jgi:hypothetical protein
LLSSLHPNIGQKSVLVQHKFKQSIANQIGGLNCILLSQNVWLEIHCNEGLKNLHWNAIKKKLLNQSVVNQMGGHADNDICMRERAEWGLSWF